MFDDETMAGAQSDADQLTERLFYGTTSPYRGYSPLAPVSVIVPGQMFRAQMFRLGDDSDRFEVTVYQGVTGFVADLWERSARTLMRMRALQHPSLPVIKDVRSDRSEEIAFTMTELQGQPIDPEWLADWAKQNPIQAFERFTVLLDALRQLHGARILHRGMTPAAFRMVKGEDDQPRAFTLARFEMSILISNLVRRISRSGVAERRETLRALHLVTDPSEGGDANLAQARHNCYLPPETHAYLFGGTNTTRRDWESTDVFGLGVFGWELFCGSLASALPEQFEHVRQRLDDGPATVTALAEMHKAMRDHLRSLTALPEPLRDALGFMLDHRPDGRKTTYELTVGLDKTWETITDDLEQPDQRPLLVAVMPDRAVETMYELRDWLSRSPATPGGRDEMLKFMQAELADASLVRSLNGARGYANGPDDRLKAAQWVLIGQRAVWFCDFLDDRNGQLDEILLVKYLTEHERAPELHDAVPRRRVPGVEVVAFKEGGQSLAHRAAGQPSWRSLTESLQSTAGFGEHDLDFLNSLDFLVTYQDVALRARYYPFRLVRQHGVDVEVELDPDREQDWRHRSALGFAYMSDPGRRPELGDFLRAQDADETGDVSVDLDRRAKDPVFSRYSSQAVFVKATTPQSVQLQLLRPATMPRAGWLRLVADRGTRTQNNREIKARQALQSQTALVQLLRRPDSFQLARHRWEVPESISKELRGNSPEIITDILATEPFFALQGPPGSGKTTTVALALSLYLKEFPGARVLVSAQSNFALDNIGHALLKHLPGQLILRETSDHSGSRRVDDSIKPLLLENLAAAEQARIAREVAQKLRNLPDDPDHPAKEERKLLLDWQKQIGQVPGQLTPDDKALAQPDEIVGQDLKAAGALELAERIRSGASIVLATSSIAATLLDRSRTLADAFDWVIIEEAAKAWPTEIMIPLVLAPRWTLIGDHRQLGPHRAHDLDAFLKSLSGYDDDLLRAIYKARHTHLKWLQLFKSFFPGEPADVPATPLEPDVTAPLTAGSPTGQLNTLFRMHPKLAEPIRRVFYPVRPVRLDENGFRISALEPDLEVLDGRMHGLIRPAALVDQPLVWVDTAGVTDLNGKDFRSVPYWCNEGEVEAVDDIVASMHPQATTVDADDGNSLAVLTLYHRQRELLRKRPRLKDSVFTVHSFQGREAHRVIVSLVRDQRVDDNPARNVGLLAQDEVINVLLSRARSLLVLVGDFRHFQENAGSAWHWVTRIIEHYGRRVKASEVKDWTLE